MATGCEIKFNENPLGVYFPGQTMRGSVELRFEELTKIKGVSLHINGAAEVKWSENKGHRVTFHTVHYQGRCNYIRFMTYLIGSRVHSMELEPGIHTYKFCYVLPQDLVTSVEAKYGHVRYTVKVVLERRRNMNQSCKVAFTVLQQVNLNEHNFNIRLPVRMDITKVFGCGLCRSKPMYLAAQVPICGYVSGQTIPVMVEINNNSKRNLEISMKLLQVISFTSQIPYTKNRQVQITLAEASRAGVGKNDETSYEQFLQVPPIPPSNNNCQVLAITYWVEVEGKLPDQTKNPRIRIPITIGTVPIACSIVSTGPNLDQPRSVGISEEATEISQITPELLPPSDFEEVVNAERTDIQDEGEVNEMGCRDYAPRYMTYRFKKVQAAARKRQHVRSDL